MFQVTSKEIKYFLVLFFFQNGYHFECHNVLSFHILSGKWGVKHTL